MADKYPGVSPYVFVRNSPIMKYDPDGNTDYTATVKTSKGTNNALIKTVTVDIVYNVINISRKDVFNSNQVVGDQYADETFSGTFEDKDARGKNVTVNVVTNVHYQLRNDINQSRAYENVMLIVDDISGGPGEKGVKNTVGMAEIGGDVMAIEHGYMSDRGLIRHEQGHNLGFNFSNNQSDPIHSPETGNYMNARSATGKNNRVGPSSPNMLKQAFGHFKNMGDGTYKQGYRNAGSRVKQFMNTINMSYDENKAKGAGIR